MKVLLVSHVFPRVVGDSVAPFLNTFVSALSQRSVELVVLAPRDRGLALYEKREDCQIYRFPYAPQSMERLAYRGEMHELVLKNHLNKLILILFLISQTVHLFRVVRREKPQLIHLHWWIPSGIPVIIVSKLLRCPYVVTTHGTDVFILKRFAFLRPFARVIFSSAKRVQCISTYVRDVLVDLVPAVSGRCDMVSMPVEEEAFPLTSPVAKEGCRILAIGRLVKRKGFSVLIEAISKLPPEYDLTIIGVGPEELALKKQAEDLSLMERITFISEVSASEISRYYRLSSIFVLPSITDWKGEKEGLGMVLLEATRMGLALICSDSGGMTDVVISGKTGLLFPENDSDMLADAVLKYADDRFRMECVKNAQSHYEANYSKSGIAQKAIESYRRSLNRS